MKSIDPVYLLVDLFSGAGGVSEGASRALVNNNRAVIVIAAVNHDEFAIKAHKENHPDTHHFVEDIRLLSMNKLLAVVEKNKTKYPNAKLIIWASLECTNFSKAKGGLPREADSRTLGNDLPRYIKALNPDGVFIENVEEFMSWGPLDENGKPLSKYSGEDYLKWVNSITKLGYNYDYRLLNAANFGAYTTRTRYFAQFMRPENVITWPHPTHAKVPQSGMFGVLEKWKPVKEVLDLEEIGTSIFDRKKPLVDNTLKRIFAGLKKFGLNDKNQFIMKYNSSSKNGSKNHSVKSINDPASTVTTRNNELNLCTAFLTSYYSNSKSAQDINTPVGTLTTKDRFSLIIPFVMRDFSSGINWKSIDEPTGALMPSPKINLVSAFLINQNYQNGPQSINEPSKTVLAGRKHQYLINPQYSSKGASLEVPCPTVIARQDKMPLSIATCLVETRAKYELCEGDSNVMIELKSYMKQNGITDIYMRMLFIPELLRIQGFGDSYKLVGSKTIQKKHIGNAVEVTVAKCLFEASAIANQKKVNKFKIA